MGDVLSWLRGRQSWTLCALVFATPVALYAGWGLILQLSADRPPGRGLEFISLLSYSLMAVASRSPVGWIERQSPRRLVRYEIGALAARSLVVLAALVCLGVAMMVLPASAIPFGDIFALDERPLPMTYLLGIAIGVLIVAYAAECLSLAWRPALLPVVAIAFYLGILYADPLFRFIFPTSFESVPATQAAVCLALFCAVAVAGEMRGRGRFGRTVRSCGEG